MPLSVEAARANTDVATLRYMRRAILDTFERMSQPQPREVVLEDCEAYRLTADRITGEVWVRLKAPFVVCGELRYISPRLGERSDEE